MFGGRPVRLTLGEEERCAQSSGEWPGVRRTFRRGLVGMELCVGGGAREDEREGASGPRLGRGERMGGGINPAPLEDMGWTAFSRGGPRTPPEALCTELRDGKEGADGSSSESAGVKVEDREARGVGGESGRIVGVEGFGDVCEGLLRNGWGGGGIALRSSSSFVAPLSFATASVGFDSMLLSSLLLTSFWIGSG